MRFQQLQYLLDIAETSSISRTAERFYSSQQGVSSSLKQLETELGVSLLNRSTNGVSLTSKGEIVAAFAQETISNFHKMQEDISKAESEIQHSPKQTIKVYSSSVIIANVAIPKAIDIFLHSYPDINIIVQNVEKTDIFSSIANDQCDIALISANKAFFDGQTEFYQQSDVVSHKLFEDKFIACIPENSPLAESEYITDEHINSHPCTVFSVSQVGDDLYQQLGKNKDKTLEQYISVSNDIEFHKRMLRINKNIITLMHSYSFNKYFSQKKYISKEVKGSISHATLHVLLHSASPSPYVAEFASLMKTLIAK